MALTTVDFTTTFNYVPSTKLYRFEDTTDYAGQGVSPASYEGVLKVVDPTGLEIYNNTNWASPDIRPGISVYNITTIPLSLDSNGQVLQGSYTFTYTVSPDNGSTTFVKSYTYTFAYTSPSVSITTAVNYNTPLISGTDVSTYTVNTITPTITRAFSMAYPAVVNIAPITGTNNVLSTDTFYVVADTQLQYTFTLTSTLSYNFGNGLFVSDVITGISRIDIYADANLCQLYCGLRSGYERWYNARGTAQAQGYWEAFEDMMAIAMLLQTAYNCGRTADVAEYVTMIKAIGNFDECTCEEGSEPTLVTGLGGSSGTIVVAAGSGIAVATNSGGGTTTYTVSIEPATLALINSITETVVEGGDGIVVTSSTAGNVTTYLVRSTVREVQQYTEYVTLTLSSGSLPVISYGDTKGYGGLLQAPTVANANNSSVSAWQTSNNEFTVSGFFTGSAAPYYPSVQLVETTSAGGSSMDKQNQTRYLNLEIIEKAATTFSVRFTNPFGSPTAGNAVDSTYESVTFLIKITA